jgi:signal recognition particle GTPase
MIPAPESYTAAMARLYADQGYLRKAAEIYRHLIGRHPERSDLREALLQIEERIAQGSGTTRKDAELLLREWIEMLKQSKCGKHNGQAGGRKNDEE